MSSSPLTYVRQDTRNGAAFLIGSDSPGLISQLKQAARGGAETPTPSDGDDDPGGPITRFTDHFSPLSLAILEHLGLSGHEIANDIQTRVAELYRNEFPVLEARFERKCETCGAEFAERVDECTDCGGDVREPDPAEKRAAEQLLENVNKEGQSLRELAQTLEWDQWLAGVPVLVIQYKWAISPQGHSTPVDWTNLIKGDPKRLVPVVDANRRIGGYWWACPRCRLADDYTPAKAPGECPECAAELREVYFAEKGEGYRSDSDGPIEAYYFEEEIVTYPWPFPRLHGLDGLSPIHHVWLKQLLIDFQDRYAAAFYDPDSDRLPNQFMILHTTNPDAWDELLEQARQNAKDDQYDSPVYSMEYDAMANERPEVQVIDAMPDELLGQNQDLRETYKTDIRRATNISNVHDNDISDAGGLNNEGLQIEVTDRPTATQMHDYTTGWLDTLAKRLGFTDWRFAFIEHTGPDAADLREEIEAGLKAEEGGLNARMVDGQTEVADGEFDPEPAAMGDPGEPIRAEGDTSSHDYGPDDPLQRAQSTDALLEECAIYRIGFEDIVWADADTDGTEVVQRAEPTFNEDGDVPANVRNRLSQAARRMRWDQTEGVSARNLRGFFVEKLSQPQGWSIQSLANGLLRELDVHSGDPDRRELIARQKSAALLNEAKMMALRELEEGVEGEVLYYWDGPQDDSTTTGCETFKAETNPEFGGSPLPYGEFIEEREAIRREHYSDQPFSDNQFHFQERHAVEAALPQDVGGPGTTADAGAAAATGD